MAKQIELRRHTDNDGDVLTDDGVSAALAVGRDLRGDYAVIASSGAQRATQTAGCFACALDEGVVGGIVVVPGLRSEHEDRWREAYEKAGTGDLEAMRDADSDFVESDSKSLGEGLETVLEMIDDGERALAVGHSPTSEAAVYGLTGEFVESISKGSGVLVTVDGAEHTVERLD